MFRVDIEIDGEIKTEILGNRQKDNFIKFLPKSFSLKHNTTLTKDDLVITMFEDGKDLQISNVKKSHNNNRMVINENDVCVMRVSEVFVTIDQHVKKEMGDALKVERDAIFSDMSGDTVTLPSLVQHDFGDGEEDAYLISEGHELTIKKQELVESFTGVLVSSDPYDKNGKFLGNK